MHISLLQLKQRWTMAMIYSKCMLNSWWYNYFQVNNEFISYSESFDSMSGAEVMEPSDFEMKHSSDFLKTCTSKKIILGSSFVDLFS